MEAYKFIPRVMVIFCVKSACNTGCENTIVKTKLLLVMRAMQLDGNVWVALAFAMSDHYFFTRETFEV